MATYAMARLLLLWMMMLMTMAMARVEYCGEKTPLTTDYIVPFYEATRPVQGCVSTERQRDIDHQIVVVRTNTTSRDVLLTLTDVGSKGVVILLDSPTAIRWRLTFFGPDNSDYKRIVVLTPGSVLAESNAEITTPEHEYAKLQVSPKMSDEKFGTIVRQFYGGLSIMAQVTGANRVSLSLLEKKASKIPSMCNLSSLTSITDSVLAFLVRKQKMFGCYHAEVAGTLPSDVHVIDLMAANPSSPSASLNNADDEVDPRTSRSASYADESQLPVVFLSMTPKQGVNGDVMDSAPRNLTLILKAAQPVRWYLESWRIKGHLHVVSTNGPVENYSLSSEQSLHIERKAMPQDFELLWRTIISETGSTPVSYVKVDVANVVSMVIPPRSKRALDGGVLSGAQDQMTSNLVPDPISLHDAPISSSRNSDLAQKILIIPGKVVNEATQQSKLDEKIRQVEKDLGVVMGKECDQKQSVVTLPRKAVAKFNVSDMTLNEESCKAVKNNTHWILSTQSTSCGSLNIFTGNNPMLRNNIHLKFAPQSEYYGRQVRIPFTCKFAAGFLGFSGQSNNDDYDYGDNDEENDGMNSDDDEMYTMRILRKHKRVRRPEVLVSRPDDQATVSVGDQLKVQTDFKTRSLLSVMIEQCWIADHSAADQRHLAAEDQWLIYEGCSANKNVTMFPTPLGTNPAFAFTVNDEHRRMGQIYVFCIMGLCSPLESLTSGNLGMCVDPTVKCASEDWHIGPAAQQLSKRGPLHVLDRRLNVEFDTSDFSTAASSSLSSTMGVTTTDDSSGEGLPESPSLHSSHVVMVGVPAEIAVAIALASFLIGASLTGMLCCIHHRKAIPKSARGQAVDSHEGSELQSMIASPTMPSTAQQSSKMTLAVNA